MGPLQKQQMQEPTKSLVSAAPLYCFHKHVIRLFPWGAVCDFSVPYVDYAALHLSDFGYSCDPAPLKIQVFLFPELYGAIFVINQAFICV